MRLFLSHRLPGGFRAGLISDRMYRQQHRNPAQPSGLALFGAFVLGAVLMYVLLH